METQENQELEVQQPEEAPKPKRRRKRNHEPKAEGLGETTPSMRGAGKYSKKPKVGKKDFIGRSPNYVTTVGLGKLKTITAHGNNEH
jgi:hypothetical protein